MQTLRHKTARFINNSLFATEYNLAVEELLEIHVNGSPYAVTMRLPGDDMNLVTGFCFTEGIIDSLDDVHSIEHCSTVSGNQRVLVRLNDRNGSAQYLRKGRTAFLNTSSSGMNGKSSVERIHSPLEPVQSFHSIPLHDILHLKDLFETRQTIFPLTGSTHAASIFDVRKNLMAFSEDIGRHNAFDKAIGALIRTDKTREAFLAVLSSRLSYEMVQKAGKLAVEILCGFSGPTSMAVAMAEQLNITLIGFLRENSMSIYTHPERILNS